MDEVFRKAVLNITMPHVVVDGVVTNVDNALTDFTVEVQVGTGTDVSTYYKVPLKVLIGTQASVIEIPNINANCLIGFRDGNLGRPQIISVDSVNQLLIKCTGDNGVIFNDGQLGGIAKIITLTTKLNNIENLMNDFISKYNSHTHEVTAVSAPTGLAVPLETGELTPTEQSEIEDKTILH